MYYLDANTISNSCLLWVEYSCEDILKDFLIRLFGIINNFYLSLQKHHETRKLDNAGCFSFGDVKYETSTALANAEVEIAYDPMNTETIKVVYQDMKPIMAHRVSIGAFCDKTVDVPVGMTDKIPETSRFLDAME